MGYDDVHAALEEERMLASSSKGLARLIHLNAVAALENRLTKMAPPSNNGGPAPAGTPAAMQVQERMAA